MVASTQESLAILVSLDLIDDNPYQARREYDPAYIDELANSILEHSLLQAPAARKVNDRYQLAFGHQRKRAYLFLCDHGIPGYDKMPLIVKEMDDRKFFEASATENFKRRDLSPVEKGELIKTYMDTFGATSDEAARLFGLSGSAARGLVRFATKLPEPEKKKMRAGKMTFAQARAVLEKPETRQKRDEVIEQIEAGDHPFDLREQLIVLYYGFSRKDVTDEMLFKRIRMEHDENKVLVRQVDILNQARLNSHKQKVKQSIGEE